MSHRTQVILTDDLYARLRQESNRTGMSLGEIVRRALVAVYGGAGREGAAKILDESFGSWRDRGLDGAAYVDTLRRGMARRLDE